MRERERELPTQVEELDRWAGRSVDCFLLLITITLVVVPRLCRRMQFMGANWTPTGLRQVKRVILTLKTTRSEQGLEKQLCLLTTNPSALALQRNSNLKKEKTYLVRTITTSLFTP